MRVHLVIDFMHIFYKYFFQLNVGKLKQLSSSSEELKSVGGDTTLIYYPLKDIEGLRKKAENNGNDVTLSVCFDSRSKRKDITSGGADGYKSNRTNKLGEYEFNCIGVIKEQLKRVGYNVYSVDGYEADDIVATLVDEYKDKFDYTVVVTNDKDVLANICDNVGALRFKQYKGYQQVDRRNFAEYLSAEFKCDIRYNNLELFLSSVGDSSDKIAGINGFGPKAFDKLVEQLSSSLDWETATSLEMIEACKEKITPEKYEQLVNSYKLVHWYRVERLDEPVKKDSDISREEVYSGLEMYSLVG